MFEVKHRQENFQTHGVKSKPSTRKCYANFRTVPNVSERKENHTLTVREAARLFEAAGVARTERSITNWCQPNRTGVARLDAYFDPNEGKYFISPQSVGLAIVEEKAKAGKNNEPAEPFGKAPQAAEEFRTVPNPEETMKKVAPTSEGDLSKVAELEAEVMDLRILNKGKNFFIEQMVSANRKVGEL